MSKQKTMIQWLEKVLNTNSEELTYNEIQSLLPALAEAQVEDLYVSPTLARQMDDVFKQYPDLQEQYTALVEVLELEAAGGLPTADELLAEFEPEAIPFAAD